MVDYTTAYLNLVQRAADVFEALVHLYSPDVRAEKDWADISAVDAKAQRNGLLERMASQRALTSARTGTFVSSIGHYLDSHWADYQEFPVANPSKREQVMQLHAKLEAILEEIAPINNALG